MKILILLMSLATAPAFASLIQVSIGNGVPFSLVPAGGGDFNTATINLCGIDASCNESGVFSITDQAAGVAVSGNVSFTTQDVGGVTTSALERVSNVAIVNSSYNGQVNVAIAFLSDQFDPTQSAAGGVGESGWFQNASDPGSNVNSAAVQGRLYEQAGGSLTNVPSGVGFDTSQSVAVNEAGPVYFSSIAQTDSIGGQTQLIGMLTAQVSLGDEVVLPGSFLVESGDYADLAAEAPEPGSFFLIGVSLTALAAIQRQFRSKRAMDHKDRFSEGLSRANPERPAPLQYI